MKTFRDLTGTINEAMRKVTAANLRDYVGGFDSIKKTKEGHHRVGRSFFYRHGSTSEGFAKHVSSTLDKEGIKHTVVDHGTQDYRPFKGGASIWSQNHHWADIKIHPDQKMKIDEMFDVEQDDESLDEEADDNTVVLKPHGTKGTHYKVVKGVPGHLEKDEVIHDTHVDDLSDMGYNVKHVNEDVEQLSEAEAVADGYHVVDHRGKRVGNVHKDSNYAIRAADKAEDASGYVHHVHHVKGGKIQKSWQFSDSQQRYAPHTDWKGEEAHHLFYESKELEEGRGRSRTAWSHASAGARNEWGDPEGTRKKKSRFIKTKKDALDESDLMSEADWKLGADTDKGRTKVDELKIARGQMHGDYKGHRAAMKKKHGIQEDVEQIDELSRKTLGSYIKKSSNDVARLGSKAEGNRAWARSDHSTSGGASAMRRQADEFDVKRNSRLKGVAKAADKLTTEDVEQIDELSKKTLTSYTDKANKQVKLLQRVARDDPDGQDPSHQKNYKVQYNRYRGMDDANYKMRPTKQLGTKVLAKD